MKIKAGQIGEEIEEIEAPAPPPKRREIPEEDAPEREPVKVPEREKVPA